MYLVNANNLFRLNPVIQSKFLNEQNQKDIKLVLLEFYSQQGIG